MTTERNHNELALKNINHWKSLAKKNLTKELHFSSRFWKYNFYLEKNKEKIYDAFQNSLLKRQIVEVETYEKIDDALLKWSTFMRGINIPITGPILLEKALEFDT